MNWRLQTLGPGFVGGSTPVSLQSWGSTFRVSGKQMCYRATSEGSQRTEPAGCAESDFCWVTGRGSEEWVGPRLQGRHGQFKPESCAVKPPSGGARSGGLTPSADGRGAPTSWRTADSGCKCQSHPLPPETPREKLPAYPDTVAQPNAQWTNPGLTVL